MTPIRDNPGVIAPPPLIFLGFLALGILLDVATDLGTRIPLWFRVAAAILLAWASIKLILDCMRRFRKAGTRVEPWQPSTALVADGPYGRSRNPIYVAMALGYLAIAFAFNSIFALLLLPGAIAVVHYGVILREERYLEAKFGDPYRRYKAQVRRWL
ncbi:methyltransferase family protein [uncultured Enterovirga sp.]|uniref:methyltransferase family protein n=1 Tax=uncultured Enterovirga sp. TaxID=2026352 RepID=UPI0035CA8874